MCPRQGYQSWTQSGTTIGKLPMRTIGKQEERRSTIMSRISRVFCLFLLVTATAAAQPTISTLSNSTAARSSRLLIQGSGFGSLQGASRVEVGGISAPLTRWSDTLIAAYVPETAATGAANVQVFDSQGFSSNLEPVTVTSRPPQNGRIRWRFQEDFDYILSRPAVGSDGTVYSIDPAGHLYALAPDGALKRQFNQNPGAFILLGPNVGPDGNIYAVATQGMGIFSLTPQGTLR